VQGEGAAEQIVRALQDLDAEPQLDLILLGRGGGSIEDLWSFNEEIVVRAVAASRAPVITGIGHEIDITLADFAADLRAATPSQAAEFAVPDRKDVLRRVGALAANLRQRGEARLRVAQLQLSRLRGSHGLRRPLDLVRQRAQRLDDLSGRLQKGSVLRLDAARRSLAELSRRRRACDPVRELGRSRSHLTDLRRRLTQSAMRRHRDAVEHLRARSAHLDAVGPRSVLSRGYAICVRQRDRKAVRLWSDVEPEERVDVVLGEGAIGCNVIERKKEWV